MQLITDDISLPRQLPPCPAVAALSPAGVAPRCSLAIAILLLLLGWGCTQEGPSSSFQGYAEGEYLYLASPLGGKLESRTVQRGATVTEGATLALLEHALESAALAEAEAGMRQAENRLADLNKGARPAEIATVAARLAEARVALGQAERELQRRERLYADKSIALETLDQARTLKERSAAAVEAIAAQLATARLGGREDAIKAGAAEVAAAKERVAQARWRLDQKTLAAPQAGYVNDTFFEEGEFVPAGAPVLALLPPANIKIRFFVPEPLLGRLAIGGPVTVDFDGSERPIKATISFIASEAEYTPPVIYSRTTRTKLVFMVEARPLPAAATRLHPGQPLEVTPVVAP